MSRAITFFQCPVCFTKLDPGGQAATACPECGWRGRAMLFHPVDPPSDGPVNAMPDDASCAHHPTKRAVAVCAGTGDYICSLCAVDLGGQTYSTAYLETAGKKEVGKAFERYLRRPDNEAVACLAISILWPLIVFTAPFSLYKIIQAFKMRNRDPLFRRVVGRRRLVLLSIVSGLLCLGFLSGVFFLIAGLVSGQLR